MEDASQQCYICHTRCSIPKTSSGLKAQTDRLRPYACDLSADRYGEGAAGLGIDRRSKNECTVDRFGNSGNLHAGSKQVAARLQLTADHGQDARVIRTAVRLQRMLGSGAIELTPNYATAHHWYAEHLGFRGRFDEAFQQSERAHQLDPLSLIIDTDKAVLLYYARQYGRAIEQFRSVLEMDPHFSRAEMLVFAYIEKGMFAEALAKAEALVRNDPNGPWRWSLLAYVYGRSGQQEQAQCALEKLNQLNRLQRVAPEAMIRAYLGMGNKDEALAWIEKTYSQSDSALLTLKVDPIYDPLRGEPRFQDLLRRVGAEHFERRKRPVNPSGQ